MAEELIFKDEAAAEYDRAFAHVTAHFMPFLTRAAQLARDMRVLDIATGTGLLGRIRHPHLRARRNCTATVALQGGRLRGHRNLYCEAHIRAAVIRCLLWTL